MNHGAPISPCINVCKLDESRMCVGCGRLLDEIANWSQMTRAQQVDVRERAAKRLEALSMRATKLET